MRTLLAAGSVSFVVVLALSACSDSSVAPTAPLRVAPTVQKQTANPADLTTSDLCGGLSPCDAYPHYSNHPGTTGVPGFCFLPPMVDNHLSDPACSGAFVPGLSTVFKLAWCQVTYAEGADGTQPPTSIDYCQPSSEWQDLVQDPNGGEFYTASVQWKKKGSGDNVANPGDVFRLYVVGGSQKAAFRDVVIDPNVTSPADSFEVAIGYGTVPVKVRITKNESACVQQPGTDNAEICLVDGASKFTSTTGTGDTVTFNFPDGNQTFLANVDASACSSLSIPTALVDVPVADCKISLSSSQMVSGSLTNPGTIQVTVTDPRWDTDPTAHAPFANARLNVLQADGAGVAALPPHTPGFDWLYYPSLWAMSSNTGLGWLGKGLEKLASLFGPTKLYADSLPPPNAGWDFTRMSDFWVAVMPVMDFTTDEYGSGSACATPSASCLDLGSFPSGEAVPVTVKVSAPTNTDTTTYPNNYFPVPDTRLHFFPGSGTLSCPGTGDCSPNPDGSVVYVTGSDGTATVDWKLGSGDNTLQVLGCGVARPGDHKETLSGSVYGTLSPGQCSDRNPAAVGFDNGPAPGLSPFEPVDTLHEVAIYGLPLTFEAHVCPQIEIDGVDGTEADGTSEWVCADSIAFHAPLNGPKGGNNAALYTYTAADTLYVALRVNTTDLANKVFLNFVEAPQDIQAPDDELLVKDFGDPSVPVDWYLTQKCVDNNSSSLCGDPDSELDYADSAAAAGSTVSGYAFYEFKRPLASPNNGTVQGHPKEDLYAVKGDRIGVRVTVTQGQGGGKGGFVYPDPKSTPPFYLFTIK